MLPDAPAGGPSGATGPSGSAGPGVPGAHGPTGVKELEGLLQRGEVQEAPSLPPEKPPHLWFLDEEAQLQDIRLKARRIVLELDLRSKYAKGLLYLLGLQLVAANVVFCIYAAIGKHWRLDDGVIQVWLAATVVQMVGVVTVVTRYLFPRRDNQPET